MQQYSKYRIITVGFILMFIFAIAAIYTNTKDIMAKKTDFDKTSEQQQVNNYQSNNLNYNNADNVTIETDNSDIQKELSNKLFDLADRIDNLEKTVFSPKHSEDDTKLNCRIQGISDDGHFVPMSDQEAIDASKERNKEVIISCIYK